MRSGLKQITWLCLLLTLLSAYGFAAHRHSSSSDEVQCTVCIAAHSASPTPASTLPSAVFVLIAATVLTELVSAKQRLIPFALTVRPPPAL